MNPTTLASYRSIADAVESAAHDLRLGEASTRESVAAPDPTEEALFRAELSEALSLLADEQKHPGVMSTAKHQLASLMQSHMVLEPPRTAGGDVKAQPVTAGTTEGLEVKFDSRDILGWMGSLFTWWRKIRPEPWLAPPSSPERVGDGQRLRVALLADWGTGLYGAPEIAKSIAAASPRYDLLLHLGDVYYSGTQEEAKTRFLDVWPKVTGAVNRTLNANHEMYTGGEGYFRTMLPAFGQGSSCCAFQTDRWLLVGLDSAYVDHDLTDDQPAWVRGLVQQAGDRRVILFSHHQPFSLLDQQGPKLVAKLGDLLSSKRIFAWYWGHEHRCVLYNVHPAWGLHGRCIGNGGFPYFRDKLANAPEADEGPMWRRLDPKNLVPGASILDAPNPYIKDHEQEYGANGYVTLDIDGRALVERVHLPDGAVISEKTMAG